MEQATWSLDILYKGYDDPKFKQNISLLEEKIKELQSFTQQMDHENEEATLVSALQKLEEVTILQYSFEYIQLRQSVDTTDSETVSYQSMIMELSSGLTKPITMINRYISNIADLSSLIERNAFLAQYAYLLRTTKEDAKYLLSDEVEEVIAKMNLNAGAAWANLRDYVTSTMKVSYQGEITNLSAIRNLAYDEHKEVRKRAFEAELASYDQVADSVAFSLNSIKGQVNILSAMRGFASPLDMTLHQSAMKKETLEAMLTAMKEYFPKFRAYLKRKATLLGHEQGLPWYDLFAPLGETQKKFTIEEAKAYLLEHFTPFAQDMADMIETAFDDRWIDFYPQNGKAGGAFCANLSSVKQSRILTNYDGALGDVVTLAHELGHAYHGMMIEDHAPLNWDYSMPLAETASTFNENIIMNAAIDAASPEDKLILIETQLQDLTQTMCDIYARYLFETEVFDRRRNEFLFADELKSIMCKVQKEAYGDGLDPAYLHPYMWVCKSHYYSSEQSFYNFPYAFGSLFARGLIVKYQETKEAFVPKYRELLKATTTSSAEDVAKLVDIDLTDVNFWRSALDTAAKRIDEFLALSE